jgi:hypothetical protein
MKTSVLIATGAAVGATALLSSHLLISRGAIAQAAAQESVPTSPKCLAKPTRSLPPLDLSDMLLWNYNGKWHPSEWANNFSYAPWRADHIRQKRNGSVDFLLDDIGTSELKSEAGIPTALRGTWEVEVTLPSLRDGMVTAPLWLYNQKLKEEIDFEFAGRRSLDVTIHAYPGGIHRTKTVPLFAGQDFSHCTLRLAIKADIPAGWAEMYVEGQMVKRFTRQELGYFPTGATRPIISLWSARDNHPGFVAWLGRWKPLPAGKQLVMTIHGYRYTPLPSGAK